MRLQHARRISKSASESLCAMYSPPHACRMQASGGRDFVYAKQLDRARRNLKPTSTT